MAVDDKFKIVLSPTFEFNKEKIQKEISLLEKKLPKLQIIGDLNTEKTRKNINDKIDKLRLHKAKIEFGFTISQFKEQVNEKLKNLKFNKAKIDVVLNTDREIKNAINLQIDNLKLHKAKIKFELDIQGSKKYIEQQIQGLKLSNIKLGEMKVDNHSRNNNNNNEHKTDNTNLPINNNLDGKLIFESIRKLGDKDVVTQIYRNSALELEKYIKTIDKQGNQIEEVTEIIKDYEKVQKNLYSDLEKQEKELIKLQSDKIDAIKNGSSKATDYDILIKQQEKYINGLKDELQFLQLQNDELQNISNKKNVIDKNKAEIQIYKDLAKEEKILADLINKKNLSSNENEDRYKNLIAAQERIVYNIRKEIEARGLANDVLEEEIYKLHEIQELNKLDKEANRQAKLGKEITSSQAKNLNFDSSMKELEEFGRSLNTDKMKFEKITALKTKVQDVNNAQKQFTAAMRVGKGQVIEYTFAIDKATNKVFDLGNKTRRVNTTIAGSGALIKEMTEKVFQWNIATELVYKTLEFFQRGFDFILDLDTSLTEVALVTGKTREEVEGLKEEYLALADATKKTVSEISKLNVELVRQGLSQEETDARMDTILKLSAVGGMDSNQTLSIITSSVNALGEEAKKTADILVYADNASASSVESIGTAMTKVASTAKSSGVSIEQLVGQVATLIDVTQEAPETLGNSLKSIMARFSKVNELGQINEDVNEVEKAFRQVGIAFTDAEGQIRPFYDLMSDMAGEWDNLDKNTQAMVATLAAGTQQQNRFLVLMQNWDRVSKMTTELESNSEGSLDKGYSVWTDSLQADINELKIAFEELWMTMLDEGQISSFINSITSIINIVNLLAEKMNLIPFILAAISRSFIPVDSIMKGFIKGMTLGSNTLIQFIFNLNKTTKSYNKLDSATENNIKSINKLDVSLKNKINNLKRVTFELQKATKKTWEKSMADTSASKAQRIYNATINSSITGLKGLTIALKSSKLAMIGLKAVSTFGLSLLIDGALSLITGLFNKSEDTSQNLEEIVNNFKDLSNTHKSDINTLKSLEKEFETLNAIVGENNDLTKLSAEEKERYLDITQQIADIAPEFVSYWDEEGNAIIKYGTNLEDIIALKKELYEIDKKQTLIQFREKSFENLQNIKDSVYANKSFDAIQNLIIQKGAEGYNNNIFEKLNIWFIKHSAKNASKNKLFEKAINDINLEDNSKKLEELQKIVNSSNYSDAERKEAEKELKKINFEIEKLTAQRSVENSKIQENIRLHKEMLSLDLTNYYNELGDSLSNEEKNLISSTANDYMENLLNNPFGYEGNALDDTGILARNMVSYVEQIKTTLNDLTPDDLSDNTDELKRFENELVQLGLSSEMASNFVNDLAIEIIGLGHNSENVNVQVESLTNTISNNFKKINNLQELYNKASNNTLSFEDFDQFKIDNPEEYFEVMEKINKGKEIEIALQEVILEKINDINSATITEIDNTIKRNQERKKELQDQINLYDKNLKGLKEIGEAESSHYRKLEEERNKLKLELNGIDKEISKLNTTLEGNKALYNNFFDESQLNTLSEQFKNATDNILKYKELLNTLDKEGINSANLIKEISSNYPELIAFIGDEIALRDVLNNLIITEEELQKQSYKLKLMYNENFYKTFLKNNDTLIKELAKQYDLDFQNFKNASQAKEAISNAIASKIAKNNSIISSSSLMNKYSGMNTQQLKDSLNSINQEMDKIQGNKNDMTPSKSGGLMDGIILGQLQAEAQFIEEYLGSASIFDKELDLATNSIDWSKFNSNISSSGSSGSSSKARKTMIDLVELEKEQYLKLNKALEKNNRLRDRNSQLMEYAYGADKIDLLKKENELLSERQKLDHELANKYREEQAKLKEELSKTIDMNSGDEGMDNFTKYMTQKENEINTLIKQINATTNQSTVDSLTEKKDKIQKEVDKFAEQYKRYIEITFNTIPDLQEDYTNVIFEKFDNMVEAMKVKLEKYEKEVSRLNVLKDLSITGKIDNTSELKRELAIHKEISAIYLNEISVTQKHAKEAQDTVKNLEAKLNNIKDKNSSEYENAHRELLLAKNMADEALKMYESNLQAYVDALNSKVGIEIQLLDKLREETKESLQDLRKEIDEFTFDNFNNSLKEIELALDKIDGIFIDNPSYTLDTSGTRDEIKDVSKTIEQIRKNTDKWKNSLEQVKKSNKSNKEIIEDIKTITTELIEVENKLNEEIAKKNQEILDLRLEYQQIEDSLQNQIDLKQEELDKIQEEFEHEQKINSLIEKRLQLLRALDDTSHMYITGQGTVEWTYDKYAVDDLMQQLSQEERQNEQDKIVQEMQDEIDKMVENLETTKEIHEQNLAVNEAQLAQLEQERDYIGSIIEDSMESLDENFDTMIDKYIDEMNTQFEKNTGVLIDIYNLLNEKVGSKGFNYNNVGVREISVGKNEESLEKIAEKYGIAISKLLALNTGFGLNTILNFGQKIKIPAFDTGGYTGNFGNEGKIAVLHQKELVLNQNDTKNLLNIVDIVRNIIGNIGNNIKLENIQKEVGSVIHIGNINLPQVNNANQFVNELQRIARGGMGRLS